MGALKEYYHHKIEAESRCSVNEIRDYPILFDSQMIQSILSGNKTETRRPFRSPLSRLMQDATEIWSENGKWFAQLNTGKLYEPEFICPWGEPGDFLWVRETTIFNKNSNTYWPVADGYVRTADYEKTIPSIQMPKHVARIWLQITEVKAQRIQSISEEEGKAEGCGVAKIYGFSEIGQSNFREGFISKWISVYGIEAYYENIWVWAIKFMMCPLTEKEPLKSN